MAALAEGPYGATVTHIRLEVGGDQVDAVHARPASTPLAGVVVCPDIGGLRPLFADICRRMATHGLAVCAVEPFARIAPEERTRMELSDRMARVRDLYDDVQLNDLAVAADHLEAADGVPRPAVLGFCMGGYYTLKAAATGRFSAAVAFYGMLRTPEHWAGPGHRSPLETAGEVCPTLAIFGSDDPWVPPDDVEALRAIWHGGGTCGACKIVVYRGADHGFVHDPDRPAHRADDAADAWRRALAFVFDHAGG